MRSQISKISSRSWLITSTAAPRRADRSAPDGSPRPRRHRRPRSAGSTTSTPGSLQDFAADDEFLQLPPERLRASRVAPALAHVEVAAIDRGRECAAPLRVDEAARAPCRRRMGGQQRILGKRHARRPRRGRAAPPARRRRRGGAARGIRDAPTARRRSDRVGASPRALAGKRRERARSGRCRRRRRCRGSRRRARSSEISIESTCRMRSSGAQRQVARRPAAARRRARPRRRATSRSSAADHHARQRAGGLLARDRSSATTLPRAQDRRACRRAP